MRPEDMTDQEVTSFNDDDLLPRVNNADQLLRVVEFQGMYTSSELARLKQFVENSKKPLYPGCHSTLVFLVISNFCSLRHTMVGPIKVLNNYWIY